MGVPYTVGDILAEGEGGNNISTDSKGSGISEDVVMNTMEFLKKKVEEHGGKLPPPSDREFYSTVEWLKSEGVKLSNIAKYLNVSYDQLRAKLAMCRKYMARDAEKAEKKALEEASVPESLGTEVSAIVMNKIRSYFGRAIDRVTLELIGDIVELGIQFYTKYLPMCKVMGMDGKSCMDSGMSFFFNYKESFDELEGKIKDLKEYIKFMHIACSDKISRYITVELMKKAVVDMVNKGMIDSDTLPKLYDSLYRLVSAHLVGGGSVE